MVKKLSGLACIFALMLSILPVQTAVAAGCDDRFLTFPAWYEGLTKGSDCDLKSPADMSGASDEQLGKYVSIIVLNVLEILLQLVLYVSIGFMLWGGFKYIYGAGSSDSISSAKKMIQNALIGLVISLIAVVLVAFIANSLSGGTATL